MNTKFTANTSHVKTQSYTKILSPLLSAHCPHLLYFKIVLWVCCFLIGFFGLFLKIHNIFNSKGIVIAGRHGYQLPDIRRN